MPTPDRWIKAAIKREEFWLQAIAFGAGNAGPDKAPYVISYLEAIDFLSTHHKTDRRKRYDDEHS